MRKTKLYLEKIIIRNVKIITIFAQNGKTWHIIILNMQGIERKSQSGGSIFLGFFSFSFFWAVRQRTGFFI